jgi:hypothetical protein
MKKHIKSPQIFSGQIFYYESVIEDTEALINSIEFSDKGLSKSSLISSWQPWSASNDNYTFGEKKGVNPEATPTASAEVISIYNILKNTLEAYGQDYASSLGLDLGSQMPISISKYFTGSSMGPHTDSSPNPTTENISAVFYLNDDYVGGELRFPQQGVIIKPKAGSIVVFPSTPPFYHESLLITGGTKYISPDFWHSIKST